MIRHLLLPLMLLPLTACGLEEYSPFDVPAADPCQEAPFSAAGSWVMEAKGKRSSCDRELYNTENYDILPLTWTFAQAQAETDPNLAMLDLVGGDGTDTPSFMFTNATVRGQCISFETAETGGVTHLWDARVVDANTLRGNFTTRGPGTCVGEGTFELRKNP